MSNHNPLNLNIFDKTKRTHDFELETFYREAFRLKLRLFDMIKKCF